MKTNMVRKHNDVIEACYYMSVPELRLIYSCISKIGFEKTISKEEPFYISAMEYSEAFGIDPKNVHREIRKAVNSIWDRELVIKREGRKPLRCRWVSADAEYEDGGAEIHFSSQVIPYLINLQKKGSFTIYRLENIGGLKSAYGIRLYELLVQYKKIGEREIEVKEIRETLSLGTKYKTMCDFKKWVLDVATKEINTETDLNVSYKNIKCGRSIVAFHFSIKKKRKTLGTHPNSPKKYLSPEDTYKEFQKSRFRHIQSYKEGFEILEKEGYTLSKTAFMMKYKK